MKNNRHEEEMNHDKITADIRRKFAEWKPEQPKLISHTVIPFYANGKWRVQIQDNKPELKTEVSLMDREIKFRGKRTDNGEWVYGDLIRRKDSFGDIVIIGSYKPDYFYDEHQVDPSTVGQFAGLKDRNGKEAYFKDIAKAFLVNRDGNRLGEYLGTIEMGDFEIEIHTTDFRFPVASWVCVDSFEIIGNVFENPELL